MTTLHAENSPASSFSGGSPGLGQIFDENAPELLRLATRLAAPGVEPADIVQSTFLRATELAHRFEPGRRHLPWLISIAKRVAFEERRRVRRPTVEIPLREQTAPVESAQSAEFIAAVADAIATLPDSYRHTVGQYLLSGLSIPEIAAEHDKPIGTIKSRLHRGLDRLRRMLPPSFAAIVLTQLNTPLRAARANVLAHSNPQAIGHKRSFTPRALRWTWAGLAVSVAVTLVLLATSPWSPEPSPSGRGVSDLATTEATSAQTAPRGPNIEPRRVAHGTSSQRVVGRAVSESANADWSRVRAVGHLAEDVPALRALELMSMSTATAPRFVAGAQRVLLESTASVSTSLDEHGAFELRVPDHEDSAWITLADDFVAFVAPVPWVSIGSGEDVGALSTYTGGLIEGRLPAAAGELVHLRVADDTAPPRSALIAASVSLANGRKTTRVAADGSFRFAAVWPDLRLSIWTVVAGRSFGTSISGVGPKQTRSVSLTALATASVTVRVMDGNGAAVPGSRVRLLHCADLSADLPSDVVVNDRGFVQFDDVLPGRAQVLATGPDIAPTGRWITVQPGSQHVQLRADPGTVLRGRVVDPDGAPVVGAEVTVRQTAEAPTAMPMPHDSNAHAIDVLPPSTDGRRTPTVIAARGVSDANGAFALHVRRAKGKIRIEPAPATSHLMGVELRARRLPDSIVLPHRQRIVARLVPADGMELPPVVRVAWRQSRGGNSIVEARRCSVDPDGRVALGTRPVGVDSVEVSASAGVRCVAALPDVSTNELDLGDVELAPPLRGRGRIVDSFGRGIAGANVEWSALLSPMWWPIGSTMSDLDGEYEIVAPEGLGDDGSFEEIDWETAIREVAQRFAAIRDTHGGESIFYYGGGGQGNHLPAAYSRATRAVLGSAYRSNALAQEKTGEFWVSAKMMGGFTRSDFEHCEVGMFIGKNPWFSHSIPRARVTLREIARDPERCLIVVDPRRTETADLADIHLAVRPGTDAWLLAAMVGILVQEDGIAGDWVAEHTEGLEQVLPHFATLPIGRYCEASGVPEDLVRRATQRIVAAESAAFFEDLGVQMNRHSTLVSYLHRLLCFLTGNFAKRGTAYSPASVQPLATASGRGGGKGRTSPVTDSRVIAGLVPCNVIPDEILTDHPKRFRAMLVESANPAHSLADSRRMREALGALDLLVVVDVAMNETARLADYVLPVSTQFEKAEATFFNFEFPRNYFHLRRPLLEPPEGLFSEAELHARLLEELGELPRDAVKALREAWDESREAFAAKFMELAASHRDFFNLAPVVLYRAIGDKLPHRLAEGAVLWALAQIAAQRQPDSLHRAGFEGEGPALGDSLFDAIVESPSGVTFSVDDYDESWNRVGTPERRIRLAVPELFDELASLGSTEPPRPSEEFPFVLSAGERRSFTANTIVRNPDWRRKDRSGALRVNPEDARRLGLEDGGRARLSTKRGSAEVSVEVSDRMQAGHVSLPNGLGLDYPDDDGARRATGVSPNELTASEDRDWLAGTPWHKHTPARIEAL